MQRQYVALLFSIAAFLGVYFQYNLRKNLVKDNSDDNVFYVSKMIVNAVIGVIALLLFLKDL